MAQGESTQSAGVLKRKAREEVVRRRPGVSRPFVQNLAASPSPFVPLAGQSTTISYNLADDLSPSLTVTVKVYDSTSTVVRTLANGSQPTGLQSVVWDGKTDPGPGQQLLPAGTYTVKVNATDGEGLAAPEQTITITLTRQASTVYRYDRLYRLTSVTATSSLLKMGLEPVQE